MPDVTSRPMPFRPGHHDASPGSVRIAAAPHVIPAAVQLVAAMAEPARLESAAESLPQADAVRGMLTGYLDAFNRHDAAAVAEHWTATGENLSLDSGELTRGREAVREVFSALFESDAEATIDIDVDAIRPLRDDVAVVDGVSRVSYADGEVAGSRFSAVVVREQDRWRLASVREAACDVPARASRPLDGLAWLVGSWENLGDGCTASGRCAWSGDRAFLARYHTVAGAAASAPPAAGDAGIPALLTAGGSSPRELTEIIGWDPERASIRSWIFSSDGRFAEATWSRSGSDWLVHVEGRGLDAGREATCTLSPDGPDGLLVRAEGDALADLLPPACSFTRTSR